MLSNQEIFVWYFEQKGVDNPERFLGVGVNEGVGVNSDTNPLINSMLQGVNDGAGVNERVNEGVNGDTNPLLNSMQQMLAGAGVNDGTGVQESAQAESANSPQKSLPHSPQENEQPENPTEENKNKTDEKQKITTNLNIDSLIKLLEVIENLKQNKTKQSELYDFINAIVSTEAE